jgi:hypothetical protein
MYTLVNSIGVGVDIGVSVGISIGTGTGLNGVDGWAEESMLDSYFVVACIYMRRRNKPKERCYSYPRLGMGMGMGIGIGSTLHYLPMYVCMYVCMCVCIRSNLQGLFLHDAP